jgi:hypothetical protein
MQHIVSSSLNPGALFLSCFILFGFSPVQATVWTVDNSPGGAAQFEQVQPAVDTALAGDTIYIHGSPNQYSTFTLNKRLIIVGPGHNPTGEMSLTANIRDVNIAEASGSVFIGLVINRSLSFSRSVDNITVRRCRINRIESIYYTGNNWMIENSIIGYFRGSSTKSLNLVVKNCVISQSLNFIRSGIILNNLFLGSGGQSFSGVDLSIIQNNIFYGTSPQGAENSAFNNNLTFQSTDNSLPYGTNTGHNNLVNIDPQFVLYTDGSFSYDHDYHLRPGSPGIGAATDGGDIGIYGGTGFSETGEPPIPVVRQLSLENAVVAPGSSLTIFLQGEAKN